MDFLLCFFRFSCPLESKWAVALKELNWVSLSRAVANSLHTVGGGTYLAAPFSGRQPTEIGCRQTFINL